jgi:hypothetical protein
MPESSSAAATSSGPTTAASPTLPKASITASRRGFGFAAADIPAKPATTDSRAAPAFRSARTSIRTAARSRRPPAAANSTCFSTA